MELGLFWQLRKADLWCESLKSLSVSVETHHFLVVHAVLSEGLGEASLTTLLHAPFASLSSSLCTSSGQDGLVCFSPHSLLQGHTRDPPLPLWNVDAYASSLVQVTLEQDKVLSCGTWRYVSIIEAGSTEKEQKAKTNCPITRDSYSEL